MISLGNQQHAIIARVSPVRDTMKSYFCFLTFCTLQSRHCRTLLPSEKKICLDISGLYDKNKSKINGLKPLPLSSSFF